MVWPTLGSRTAKEQNRTCTKISRMVGDGRQKTCFRKSKTKEIKKPIASLLLALKLEQVTIIKMLQT